MNAPLTQALEREQVAFKLNGAEASAFADETIIQAADRLGVAIPRLCYKPGMRPDGNCRACMVEIKGERVLAPSCCRRPTQGMEVSSTSARAVHSQKMIVELLASDMPARIGGKGARRSGDQRERDDREPAAADRVRGGEANTRRPGEDVRVVPERPLAPRVRLGRPDGRVNLCRLWRMRAGVPDGSACARARRVSPAGRPSRGFGVSVLRGGLPAHLSRRRQSHRPRRRSRRSRES